VADPLQILWRTVPATNSPPRPDRPPKHDIIATPAPAVGEHSTKHRQNLVGLSFSGSTNITVQQRDPDPHPSSNQTANPSPAPTLGTPDLAPPPPSGPLTSAWGRVSSVHGLGQLLGRRRMR
jgi:hypothetical protein